MTRLDFILLGYVLFLILLVALSARAEKKIVNLEIPPSCAKKILLKDCELNGPVPKCKTIFVDYSPASCAIVHLD